MKPLLHWPSCVLVSPEAELLCTSWACGYMLRLLVSPTSIGHCPPLIFNHKIAFVRQRKHRPLSPSTSHHFYLHCLVGLSHYLPRPVSAFPLWSVSIIAFGFTLRCLLRGSCNNCDRILTKDSSGQSWEEYVANSDKSALSVTSCFQQCLET